VTAIPHAAEALTSASGRFEFASARLLEAASGVGGPDMAHALVEMSLAKTQFKAGIAVMRFADDMWDALIELAQDTKR
jgi:flagellar hook protein FlgE